MPVVSEAAQIDEEALGSLDVAFINNLSDAALAKTERQFSRLFGQTPSGGSGRWERYRLVPSTSDSTQSGSANTHYADMGNLRRNRPDVVIVTGAEPTTTELWDEPLWRPLVDLLNWAEHSGTPVLLSCLAAHAAVLHFDGIRRFRLPKKRFGIFEHEILQGRDAMGGAPQQIFIPHSRWNELPESALTSHGYRTLTRSVEAGVDMFLRPENDNLLFCQGHPEYEPTTLLGEYRRDILRYLRKERITYPEIPVGCFDDTAIEVATAFRQQAEVRQDPQAFELFPYEVLERGLDWSWHLAAAGIVGRWLQKAHQSRICVTA